MLPRPVLRSRNGRDVGVSSSKKIALPPTQSIVTSKIPTASATRMQNHKKHKSQDILAKNTKTPLPRQFASSVTQSATPSLPPNWKRHMESTIASLDPYKLFTIPSDTLEYAELTAMLNPLEIIEAEQIVNSNLWSRFLNTRKTMLQSKSDNLQLLTELKCDEAQVVQSAHVSFNFVKNAAVEKCPYDDNMALLFHCTRSPGNVESILRQGLDERVGSTNALLGKGIYFADDPCKSQQYDGCNGIIFVFGVLLGDCLSVDHLHNKKLFVREPEKEQLQKRNVYDYNFDSIVARLNGHTEYVVYNRYQCCPLYKISYRRDAINPRTDNNNIYCQSRNHLPPLSWLPAKSPLSNSPTTQHGWPFYARTIFTQMGVRDEETAEATQIPEYKISEEGQETVNDKVALLLSLGFTDVQLNIETLTKYSYDVDKSLNHLLDQAANTNQSATSSIIDLTALSPAGRGTMNCSLIDLSQSLRPEERVSLMMDSTSSQFDTCMRCSDHYAIGIPNWAAFVCNHKLCVACCQEIEITRTTMCGVSKTFIKCPFCIGTLGLEIGTCPDGIITITRISTPCEGYNQYNTISINYNFMASKYLLSKTAYLPNCHEGNELLTLLKVAWDRRITFSIEASIATGEENALLWNIPHKTSTDKGGMCGFPDPNYIVRTKRELRLYGIE